MRFQNSPFRLKGRTCILIYIIKRYKNGYKFERTNYRIKATKEII